MGRSESFGVGRGVVDLPLITRGDRRWREEHERAETGCDDYDTKPVEMERLLGKIQKLLGTN